MEHIDIMLRMLSCPLFARREMLEQAASKTT